MDAYLTKSGWNDKEDALFFHENLEIIMLNITERINTNWTESLLHVFVTPFILPCLNFQQKWTQNFNKLTLILWSLLIN